MNCNFCGKARTQVAFLVTGPDVYICSGCIILCVDILHEQGCLELGVSFNEVTEGVAKDTLFILKGKLDGKVSK